MCGTYKAVLGDVEPTFEGQATSVGKPLVVGRGLCIKAGYYGPI